eukprot:339648-Pyramimonas_sp.AAC.2
MSHEQRVDELRDKLQNITADGSEEILDTLKRDPKTALHATERTKEWLLGVTNDVFLVVCLSNAQIIDELLANDKQAPLPTPSGDLAKLKRELEADKEQDLKLRLDKLEEEQRQQ